MTETPRGPKQFNGLLMDMQMDITFRIPKNHTHRRDIGKKIASTLGVVAYSLSSSLASTWSSQDLVISIELENFLRLSLKSLLTIGFWEELMCQNKIGAF